MTIRTEKVYHLVQRNFIFIFDREAAVKARQSEPSMF